MILRKKVLVAGVLSFWFFAIAYATITIESRVFVSGVLVSGTGDQIFLPYAALFLVLVGAIILARNLKEIVYLINAEWSLLVLVFLVFVLFFNSMIKGNVESVSYVLLFASSLIVTLYANVLSTYRFYLLSAVAVLLVIFSFVVVHGFPVDRWIGGIHPNHVGAFSLLGAFFAARSQHALRWYLYVFALVVAILVSARYAVIAIMIIILSDYLSSFYRLNYSRIFASILLGVAAVTALVYGSEFLVSRLAVFDPERGLGGGFTGRTELWMKFWPQFSERPFLGHGFRQRDNYDSTHNGFLDFGLENGVIAIILVGVLLLLVISENLRQIIQKKGQKDIVMNSAFWVAWGFAGFFQPQIINFGDAYAIMTAFVLTMRVRTWRNG
jgi:O-antigen ligase